MQADRYNHLCLQYDLKHDSTVFRYIAFWIICIGIDDLDFV